MHICNRTIPVACKGEFKREQNDSFEKLRSSAGDVRLAASGEMTESIRVFSYILDDGQSIDSS